MKEYFDLFLTFCRIGGLTFGGGYAMLPIIQREVVEGKQWATSEEIADYFAVGQCLPGIIAVNTSIFIGYKRKGVPGGIAAALGVVFPSLVIITIIAAFIQNFIHLEVVAHAFAGVRVAVLALVVKTLITLFKSGVKDVLTTVLCIAAFVLTVAGWLSPMLLVVSAALIGILSGQIKARRVTK